MKPVLYGILVTPSTTNSQVIIKESVGGITILNVKIEAVESRYIDFTVGELSGLELKSVFEVDSLVNIESVILYGFWDQPVNRAKGTGAA